MTFHNLFSVPVHEFQLGDECEDFLNEISEYLLEQRDTQYEELEYSIRGKTSHHTRDNLCHLDTDWSRQLRALIVKVTNEYRQKVTSLPPLEADAYKIHCWGMVMSAGDFSTLHNHPGCDACGTMWLRIPPKENRKNREGQFIFMDPVHCRRVSDVFDPNIDVEPKEGVGLVFPSWLEHYVEPFYCEGDRLSIAWNVTAADQRP